MEPKFKSSFIPKSGIGAAGQKTPVNPVGVSRSGGDSSLRGFGAMLALILFVLSVAASGAIFLYTKTLETSIDKKTEMLQRAREAFQPALIKELVRLDARMRSADEILSAHVAPSTLFTLLEQTTLRNVQMTRYSYELDQSNVPQIEFEGVTDSLASVSLQADVYKGNQFIQNPAMSRLNVNGEDDIVFTGTASLDDRLLSFQELVRSLNQ